MEQVRGVAMWLKLSKYWKSIFTITQGLPHRGSGIRTHGGSRSLFAKKELELVSHPGTIWSFTLYILPVLDMHPIAIDQRSLLMAQTSGLHWENPPDQPGDHTHCTISRAEIWSLTQTSLVIHVTTEPAGLLRKKFKMTDPGFILTEVSLNETKVTKIHVPYLLKYTLRLMIPYWFP